MAGFISSKLLVLAVGALTIGAGLFATTGTASADGPYGGNDWLVGGGHGGIVANLINCRPRVLDSLAVKKSRRAQIGRD